MGLSYERALAYLYGLQGRGVQLGLERMRRALELASNPERDLRVVHVGGTNGKGSVCTMLEEILRRSGHRVGLYTSPHLHRFTERIRVDGRPIEEDEVAARIERLRTLLDAPAAPPLTFFETATVMALEAFRDAKCDIVVLEVGLGGRLDATNVVTPLVSVITNIGLDHQDRLGTTLQEIASEKAGILKPGVPAVLGVRDPSARSTISARAAEVGAPCLWIGDDFEVTSSSSDANPKLTLRVGTRVLERVAVGLLGDHQHDNIACAVAAAAQLDVLGVPVPSSCIREGLACARWPGRLEWIDRQPRVLLDAAHNVDGCRMLAAYLGAHSMPTEKTILVFSAMNDKDIESMLEALRPHVDAVVYAGLGLARAAPRERLECIHPGRFLPSVEAALAHALLLASPGGKVVVAGSIFLVAEARARLLGIAAEPSIPM